MKAKMHSSPVLIVLIILSISKVAAAEKSIAVIASKFPRCSAINAPIQEKFWKCPEGSPAILTSQICDGFLHCQRTFADERNCVRLSNDSGSDTLSMARMYVPSIQCSATICYSEHASSNEINAHLICRHLGFMTYKNVGFMQNNNNHYLSLGYDSLHCFGHESNIQHCLKEDPNMKLHPCKTILTVECQPECQHDLQTTSGTIVSPGYPILSFSMLDCIWTITGPEGSVFDLQFTNINLQDMVELQDVDEENEPQDGDLCSNSYIEIGLGYNESNKAINRFKRLRLCRQLHVKNYTSLGNRIYIRYISGQYFGPLEGLNGFEMMYKNIQITNSLDAVDVDVDIVNSPPPLSGGYIALIAICAILGSFSCTVVFIWWYKRRQNEFRLKRKYDEEIYKAKCKSNDYLKILLHAYDMNQFPRILTCPKCNKACKKSSDLCGHFKRLHNSLIQEDNDRIAKEFLSSRMNGTCRNKNTTRISNATVDLDELFGSRGLEQCPSVTTLIKPRELETMNVMITSDFNEEPAKKSFMVMNFLEPLASVAKKLSSSSWRTPSPNKTSTPTLTDQDKREKRRQFRLNQSKNSISPDSPMIATIRQTARKLKMHPDFHLNPKKVLKVSSTSAKRLHQKPPKIVVVPSSVRRQPSSPTFVRNYDKKPRSVSLQLLTVNQANRTNNLSPIFKRYPSKPESAPGQLGDYSNFQSLSNFSVSPLSVDSSRILNQNIVVDVHNSDSIEQTPQVFVHL